jgi:hypothetical protein
MLVLKRQLTATPIPVTKATNENEPNTTGVANGIAVTTGSISLYPNPVTEAKNVMIRFNKMDKGNYEVTIYGASGRKLLSKKIQDNGGNNLYSLRANPFWAAGVYTVTVLNEASKKVTVLKLVVSK